METSLTDTVFTTIVCTHCSNVSKLSKKLSSRHAARDTQHAPDGVPPSGNAKDALDTVA
jgi:hypothetical protein